MQFAYEKFNKLIEETKNVQQIYHYLKNVAKVPLDISDLLRWQWVQYVSALDKLVHDLVRIGMLNIYEGKCEKTPKYKTFQLDIETYNEMQNQPIRAVTIFEQKIVQKHGFLAFQDPNKISEALSFIWNENDKWGKIAYQMEMPKEECVAFLKNIVIRRNQIVHEGDYTDALSQRQDIFEQDIEDIRIYILKLGNSIYNLVK